MIKGKSAKELLHKNIFFLSILLFILNLLSVRILPFDRPNICNKRLYYMHVEYLIKFHTTIRNGKKNRCERRLATSRMM